MRLRFLAPALSDLEGISRYIAQDNPKAARRVVAEVRRQARILAEHPHAGRVGRVDGTRELVITPFPYIVTYRVDPDEVQILAVVHTSRRWPKFT
jgi:toxin ParE1/3/4